MTIDITTYKNRRLAKGIVRTVDWEELKNRLRHPVITEETFGEYFGMTNEERTEIKDVGGFVGGVMRDGIRRKDALVNRTLLTIDVDEAVPGDVEDFMIMNDEIFCCHTTHSATEENPRQRWIFPLSRPVTPEEYRVIAREVCSRLGLSADDTTDQPERLMFWPSQAFDAFFQFWEGGTVLLNPDEILSAHGEQITSNPDNGVPQKEKTKPNGERLVIPEGGRNKTVFGFAAGLRGNGLDYEIIRRMVSDYNETYCVPPLPETELDTICRSVCGRYKRGEAVASSLRDAWDDFNDLGNWVEPKPKKIEKLEAESMASLGSRHIDPPKFVVPGLIPYGITILASPPKFGKSWMCLDLAISVATGTEFMGLKTNKDGVTYLALEDGDYRLQDRSIKVANGRELPKNLLLVKEAPVLAEGLLPKLNQLIESAGFSVGMIIIDTLQKVRGVAGKTEGVYGYDYRELGQLHQFAIDRNLALVIVHHLNKGGDDSDFVSRLNGSTGVSGAADTIITLTRASRGSDETKMSITGRDVQERVLIIKMDWSNYRWILLGDEKDVERDREDIDFHADPLVKTILWGVQEAEDMALADEESSHSEAVWQCTSQELMDAVKRLYGTEYDSPSSVGIKVSKLVRQLEDKEGVRYEKKQMGKRRVWTHFFAREII